MAIKRSDGITVGGTNKVQGHTAQLPIAALLPLEGAVVTGTLNQYRSAIKNGKPVLPAKAVAIDDGIYLITDGNHRVYAAKLEGKTEVDVRVVDPGINAKFYTNSAKHARRRNRLGFDNIEQVSSDDARKVFTEAEAKANDDADFLADLT